MSKSKRTVALDELSTRCVGMKFGQWEVIGAPAGGFWEARCICGAERLVPRTQLLSGESKSCGCGPRPGKQKCELGKKYGTLTVIGPAPKNLDGRTSWLCRCDCGKEKIVTGKRLRSGNTRSCGASTCRQDYRDIEARIASGVKLCRQCNRVLPFTSFCKNRTQHDGVGSWCRECTVRKNRARLLTLEARAKVFVHAAKSRSRRRGTPYDLTIDFVIEKLRNGCERTGVPFVLNGSRNAFSPSMDQVRCGEGYTQDNVQFVVLAYNLAKGDWTDDDVLKMAEALVRRKRPVRPENPMRKSRTLFTQ